MWVSIQEWFAPLSAHWHLGALAVALGGLLLLAWLVRFWGRASWSWRRKPMSDTMQILDSCPVDYERRLVMFSSPFGQGLILVSPKGDRLVLLPNTPGDSGSHYTDDKF